MQLDEMCRRIDEREPLMTVPLTPGKRVFPTGFQEIEEPEEVTRLRERALRTVPKALEDKEKAEGCLGVQLSDYQLCCAYLYGIIFEGVVLEYLFYNLPEWVEEYEALDAVWEGEKKKVSICGEDHWVFVISPDQELEIRGYRAYLKGLYEESKEIQVGVSKEIGQILYEVALLFGIWRTWDTPCGEKKPQEVWIRLGEQPMKWYRRERRGHPNIPPLPKEHSQFGKGVARW